MAYDKIVDSGALDGRLGAIADAIRGKTGGTEKLTLDGMAAAIAGIQAGGGLAYDMGEFVLDADTTMMGSVNGIPHALGETPDFVLIWTDDLADLDAENVSPHTTTTFLGYIWLNGLMGLPQRLTSAVSSDLSLFIQITLSAGDYRASAASPTSASYTMSDSYLPTREKIGLVPLGNANNKWRAGLVYKYFVARAWWNVGGVPGAD